ncbi:MAG: hypothetical protein LBK91_04485, partial [Synergistaceae bacterium]|nr:hypothetical protein [Synergistaceae bacterium]
MGEMKRIESKGISRSVSFCSIRPVAAIFCLLALVLASPPKIAFADFEIHVSTWESLCNFIKNYANTAEMTVIYLDEDIDAVTTPTVGGSSLAKWVTIDGQGHTIDAGGAPLSSLRFANTTTSNNIILRNLTMKNFQTQDLNGG